MVLPTQIRLRLLIALSGCLILISCKNEISDIRAITDMSKLPVQTSYNAEYIVSEKGKVTNRLFAGKLEQFQDEDQYILASGGVQVIFYDSLENEEARLTARQGAHYSKEKKLIARDSVVLVSSKGERLETEELIYLEDSAKIFTDRFVKIVTSNGSTLYGNGLVSNDSFTKWRIKEPHDGKLYISEENE
ncbi:MAG TPA: LPS export ABC transporter periplasmic protein LptC [Flavobacteriales bacterium]